MWHRAMSHRAGRLLHLLATGTAQVLHRDFAFIKLNIYIYICVYMIFTSVLLLHKILLK